MRLSLRLLSVCTLLFAALSANAQDEGTIFLRNASFEDMPRNSAPPKGWTNCGFPGESPPDVHPDPAFEFRVSKPAQDGLTYLGMVTRENDTYESVGQQLTEPLAADQCYTFGIHLARSEVYLSRSRKSDQPSNYVTPIKLRVFGGYSVCDRRQLLGESDLVGNYDWQEYRFKLRPEQPFTHIVLEAYYKQPILLSYNGNLLLDNAQPLRPIACDPEVDVWDPPAEEIITYTDPETDIQTTSIPEPRILPAPGDRKGVDTFVATPPKETVKIGKVVGTLEENSVFAIEDITFEANSSQLKEDSKEALESIVGFLKQYDNVVIEIGGHASRRAGSYTANSLSESRATVVKSYLLRRSIGADRLLARGYGKTKPVCEDDSKDCNRRNQRVEVKILKIRETK